MRVEPNRRPNVKCDMCETVMYRRLSTLARNAGKFCSRACRNRAHPPVGRGNLPIMHGADNPAWKGGVCSVRRKGNYGSPKYVRCPQDLIAMAREDGWVMEHRAVMARRCGFALTRTECVHHMDHNVKNNDPANLELWPDNRSHRMAEHGRIMEGVTNRIKESIK